MDEPQELHPQAQAVHPNAAAAIRSIGEGLISATGGNKRPGWLPSDGWLWGLAPILFAALRVLVVSRGDTETLRALVQNLNVTALVLATILPFGALVSLVTTVSVFMRWRLPGVQPGKGGPFLFLVLMAITGILLLFAMPVWQMIAAVSAVGAVVLFFVLAKLAAARRQKSGKDGVGKPVLILLVGALLAPIVGPVIYLFGWSGMWLPQERITVGSTYMTPAYVLSSDQRWTSYMDEHRKVHLVPTPDITRREATSPSREWSDKSLADNASSALSALRTWLASSC
jgi:hypothetical protein